MAYDLMEPHRPSVDREVLTLVQSAGLAATDFVIDSGGACHLNPELARYLTRRTGLIDTPRIDVNLHLALGCMWAPRSRLPHAYTAREEVVKLAKTARVQCVFLDTVGFTNNRSVEAQSDIVAALNTAVTAAVDHLSIGHDNFILIPTGDGMAIALTDVPGIDVHLRLALEILRLVAKHNADEPNEMRQFEIRIGINENVDNIVTDVNGRTNVAGAGISMAQRIMDRADGGQILVSYGVFDILRQRELYMKSFRQFHAIGKHDIRFPVYQYAADGVDGLNIEVPSCFRRRTSDVPKLTEFAAFYICHSFANRDYLVAKKTDEMRSYAGVVLLEFLADDSVSAAHAAAHEDPIVMTWHGGTASFDEQYKHYRDCDFWVLAQFAESIGGRRLGAFSSCFEADPMPNYVFANEHGRAQLVAESPEIARMFGIEVQASEPGD